MTILDVVKKEVTKLLAARIIYPISESQWVSPIQVVPKKSRMTVMKNRHGEIVLTRIRNNWRVCIDYKKLNQATRKDHFPLPFIDQISIRRPLRVHSVHSPIPECCLDCVTPQVHSREGIVLGHLVSSGGIEVDKAKVDIIASLPNPASMWEVRSFLGHVGFYRRFIKNFNKIALPLSKLLLKDVDFVFDQPFVDAFQELKKRLTSTSIL
ncbi:putative mitochondrial protein, partial [Mucuna pruriens]